VAAPTKFFSYCAALYKRMELEAVAVKQEGSELPNEYVHLWRGRVVETILDLDIPMGSYAKVVKKLRELGCIEQVTRGFRGDNLSEYVLHYPPTEDRWGEKISPRALTGAPTPDSLSAQVKTLQDALQTITGGLNIVEAFSNIERRLRALEDVVQRTNGTEAKP
jgi:hypothetical protein